MDSKQYMFAKMHFYCKLCNKSIFANKYCASALCRGLDWLQSIKQFFINVSYNILVASLTPMALKTKPSELGWLQVYDMTR